GRERRRCGRRYCTREATAIFFHWFDAKSSGRAGQYSFSIRYPAVYRLTLTWSYVLLLARDGDGDPGGRPGVRRRIIHFHPDVRSAIRDVHGKQKFRARNGELRI